MRISFLVIALSTLGCSVAGQDAHGLPCGSALCGGDGAEGDDADDANDTNDSTDGEDDGLGEADSGDDGPSAAGGIPCDVRDALAAQCHECHSATPSFGAPMPLATVADFQVPSVGDNTRPVF